ncbi:MAG: hypothetical protein ACTSO7_03680 [Candidatus Heimdallarchaeota archaeon]
MYVVTLDDIVLEKKKNPHYIFKNNRKEERKANHFNIPKIPYIPLNSDWS